MAGIRLPREATVFRQVCEQGLSDLAYGCLATIESSKLDRYDSAIGNVIVEERHVNLEQLLRGCGWHYKRYQNEQSLDDRLAYNAAEASPRGRGGAVVRWEYGSGEGCEKSRPD